MFSYTREESDLPPQIPSNLIRDGKNVQTKKNVRIRSLEDNSSRQRRTSMTTTQSNNASSKDDGNISQLESNRSHKSGFDILRRPLWNYQNQEHREYIPNSRRDPNYERRQKQKAPEIEQNDRFYSRSKNELETERTTKKPPTQTSPVKTTRSTRRDAFLSNRISSLDKYEHFIPYTRTDEVLDPSRAFSPIPNSRETTPPAPLPPPPPPLPSTNKYRSHQTENFHQNQSNAHPPPYHVAPSRQDHILQQLSAIKEVRID